MHILDGTSSVTELKLDNQRVLVRADLDVPTGPDCDALTELKIKALLPTLKLIAEKEARVIIAAHRGPPAPSTGQRRHSGKAQRAVGSASLESVGAMLSDISGWEVFLPDDCLSDSAKRVIADLRAGQVCLLENLRFHGGEATNDDLFARALAGWCDVYVNDALACCHERHASVFALPRLVPVRGTGLLLQRELTALSRLTQTPSELSLAILGGPASRRRLDLLETLLELSGNVCVGGGLALPFLQARGYSMVEPADGTETLARCRSLLDKHHGRIQLPVDFVVSNDHASGKVFDIGRMPAGHHATDIGPETVSSWGKFVAEAQAIVYTGLMSVPMNARADEGSLSVLGCISEARGFSIVTGNESVKLALAGGSNLIENIDHMSLGADATLAFIAGRKLPGIDALRGANNE